MTEVSRTFTCFGGATTVAVEGGGPAGEPEQAVQMAIDLLLDLHATFTRFKPESELSRLNDDPRDQVPVSPVMGRFIAAALQAARATGGLVDFTMLDAIERAGYREDRFRGTLALPVALALAPARRSGSGDPGGGWTKVHLDANALLVTRPPGLRFDGGGIVKGLAADLLSERLAGHAGYAVDCEGDLRVGGGERAVRMCEVTDPFGGAVLHEFALLDGALATSSIAKRSWFESMRPTHHVLDPATKVPAFTGLVQVSALAPSAVEGEALAKAALLSGPEGAPAWLPHGGLVVCDDGSHTVVPQRPGVGNKRQ